MRLVIFILLSCALERIASSEKEADKGSGRTGKGLHTNPKMIDNRNIFSPRMEYDEWTPLGRGDPLKNDPTYDYVPPVLDRVHYWMEPSKRTPDPPALNSGLLILGSSRTEPSFTMRLTTPKYQIVPVKEPQADSRLDAMSLLDPILKLMDVSKFGINLNPNVSPSYYKPAPNANRIHQMNNYQRPLHHQQFNTQRYQQPQALQRPPYTILMPPPPPPPTPSPVTFATISTITEPPETATTQVSQTTTATTTTTTTPTTTTPEETIATITTTKSEQESINITTVYPTTVLANTENLYKPVAIAMPEENETIKSDSESYREKAEAKKKNNFVKPTEDSMVLPIVTMFNKEMRQAEEAGPMKPDGAGHLTNPRRPQEVMANVIRAKEPFKYRPLYEMGEESNRKPGNKPAMAIPPKGMKIAEKTHMGGKWGEQRATTARPVTTTRANTLTTDPMFKHYKQPSEPVKGPFYLIIQGHSKVKTYGASKNPINGMLTSNEIREEGDDRKDHLGDFYEFDSQEATRKRGKSILWHPHDGNLLGSDGRGEGKKRFDSAMEDKLKAPAISGVMAFAPEYGLDDVQQFEEAFGQTDGGSSKKRFLVNDETTGTLTNRQLLSVEPNTASGKMITVASPTTESSEPRATAGGNGPHIESFISLNEDYRPEDVIDLLLKHEGQGSELGNLVISSFSKSLKESSHKRLKRIDN